MRLYSNQERSFAEIRHVAVAIAMVEDGRQHVGILHKIEIADEARFCHLAWHHELKDSQPKDSCLWVDPPIPRSRARQVAARCRQILRGNERGIPYAFSPPNDCFDLQTGVFLLGEGRRGLTCASFVLAVFDASGLRLAEYDSWPLQRAGDKEWQQFIVNQLKRDGATPEHIAFVEKEIGSVRYRPEDVAGCAASEKLPCLFEIAEPLSLKILDALRLAAKTPQP